MSFFLQVAGLWRSITVFLQYSCSLSAPADMSPAAKKFLKLMDITTTAEPTEEDRLGQKVVEWFGRKSMYLNNDKNSEFSSI